MKMLRPWPGYSDSWELLFILILTVLGKIDYSHKMARSAKLKMIFFIETKILLSFEVKFGFQKQILQNYK